MKVTTAAILGLVAGVGLSWTPFPLLIGQIMILLLLLSVLSILLKKKIITGPIGGFLLGLGAGISLGSLIFKGQI